METVSDLVKVMVKVRSTDSGLTLAPELQAVAATAVELSQASL